MTHLGQIIEVPNRQGTTARFRVWEIKEGKARLDWADRTEALFGPWMPVESVEHFEYDLRAQVAPSVVQAGPSGHPAVDAVLRGEGIFLGKGDDGVVFRVGDVAVKMSTTVPYQPMNQGHRTPAEAAAMLEAQAELAQRLAAEGVPGILAPQIVRVGAKSFEVKPFLLEIEGPWTKTQLDQVAQTLAAVHARGLAFRDTDLFQVGLLPNGDVAFYDIGKMGPGRHDAIWDDFNCELRSLEALYAKHGVSFVPPAGGALERAWADAARPRPWWAYQLDIGNDATAYLAWVEEIATAAELAGVQDVQPARARIREGVRQSIEHTKKKEGNSDVQI